MLSSVRLVVLRMISEPEKCSGCRMAAGLIFWLRAFTWLLEGLEKDWGKANLSMGPTPSSFLCGLSLEGGVTRKTVKRQKIGGKKGVTRRGKLERTGAKHQSFYREKNRCVWGGEKKSEGKRKRNIGGCESWGKMES